MNRSIAESLMAEIALLDKVLDKGADIIETMDNEVERKEFRRAIATIMGEVYIQLMVPILTEYPDLDPDLN